jgi:hypothetical protein
MKVPGLHTIRTMPGQIADGVSALTGAAGHATTAVTRVPSEVLSLLSRVEDLVTRMEILMPTLDKQLARVDTVMGRTETLVADASVVLERAERLVAFTEPLIESAVPVARVFTEHANPEHVVSVMAMLDLLPELSVRIVPAAQSLVELTPELDLLIERFDNVAKIVQGMPGARLFQRRTEASEQTDSE